MSRGRREGDHDPGDQLVRRLKTIQRESGLTQAQLARRLDIDPSSLSRILRGHVIPRWTVVEQLLVACGSQIDPDLRDLWRSASGLTEHQAASPTSTADPGVDPIDQLVSQANKLVDLLAQENGLLALLIADTTGVVERAATIANDIAQDRFERERQLRVMDLIAADSRFTGTTDLFRALPELHEARNTPPVEYLELLRIASPDEYRRMPKALLPAERDR